MVEETLLRTCANLGSKFSTAANKDEDICQRSALTYGGVEQVTGVSAAVCVGPVSVAVDCCMATSLPFSQPSWSSVSHHHQKSPEGILAEYGTWTPLPQEAGVQVVETWLSFPVTTESTV